MTKRKAFKQLRKRLSKKYKHSPQKEYGVVDTVRKWVEQSGIECTDQHVDVLFELFGSVFYPYQKSHRKIIIKRLKQ